MSKLMQALRGWWDATDRTKDVKLLAFAAVVAFTILWLSWDLFVQEKITASWVDTFKWACGLVGLGGPAWAWAESKMPPTPPGGGQ